HRGNSLIIGRDDDAINRTSLRGLPPDPNDHRHSVDLRQGFGGQARGTVARRDNGDQRRRGQGVTSLRSGNGNRRGTYIRTHPPDGLSIYRDPISHNARHLRLKKGKTVSGSRRSERGHPWVSLPSLSP